MKKLFFLLAFFAMQNFAGATVWFTTTAPTTATVDGYYVYEAHAQSTDSGAVINYSLNTAPSGMTVNTYGFVQWNPSTAGNYNVTLKAELASNPLDFITQTWTIIVSPALPEIIFTSHAATYGVVGESYSYDVDAIGNYSGYNITYSFNGTPPSLMTINATTGVISWTPTATGSFPVSVKAEDGSLFAIQNWTINVFATNLWFVSTAPTTGNAGVTYSYNAYVQSADSGAAVDYELLSPSPSDMTVSSYGQVLWTPTSAGVYTVNLKAMLRSDHSIYVIQTWTITVAPPDPAITGISISNNPICMDSPLIVTYTAIGTFNPGNNFTAELCWMSIPDSTINTLIIGTVNSTSSGTINANVPSGTSTGNNYWIRIVSSDPPLTGNVRVNIISLSQPPARPIITEIAGVLTSSAATGNQWFLNGTILQGETDYSLSPSVSGNYTVQATNADGCQSEMSDIYVYTAPSTVFNVSGIVKDASTSIGISNATVKFYRIIPGQTTAVYLSSETTDALGAFSTTLSLVYQYIVMAEVSGGTINYIPKFWDNKNNVLEADIITITADVNNLDFNLEQASSNSNQFCGSIVDDANTSTMVPSWIILYKYDASVPGWVSCRTFQATSGSFAITGLDAGLYMLQSQPFSDSYAPGYYISDNSTVVTGWSTANQFTVTASSQFCPIIVKHQQITGGGSGSGGYSGVIIDGSGGIVLKGKGDKVNAETPVRGASVYLLSQPDGNIIKFAYSDNLGKFDIKELQLMGYDVIIDKVNYDEYLSTIKLTKDSPVDSASIEIVPTPINVEEENPKSNIFIYPNPASEIINLVFSTSSVNVRIRLLDCLGSIVYTTNYHSVQGLNTITIKPTGISSGFYIVQIFDKNQNTCIPIIIKQ